MYSRRLFICLLMASAFVAAGCQQKNGRSDRQRIGRLARGPVTFDQYGNPRPYQSNSGSVWSEVTDQNQNAFNGAVQLFAAPSLQTAPEEERLGFVSAYSSMQTGVAFWGEVRGINSGQIDGSRSRIHIEVYDDRYGMTRSNGTTIEQLVVHIGYDQPGFVRAYGNLQQGLVFEDNYGAVILRGSIQGGQFVGDMYYTNQFTSGMEQRLGQFRVQASGFFFN